MSISDTPTSLLCASFKRCFMVPGRSFSGCEEWCCELENLSFIKCLSFCWNFLFALCFSNAFEKHVQNIKLVPKSTCLCLSGLVWWVRFQNFNVDMEMEHPRTVAEVLARRKQGNWGLLLSCPFTFHSSGESSYFIPLCRIWWGYGGGETKQNF